MEEGGGGFPHSAFFQQLLWESLEEEAEAAIPMTLPTLLRQPQPPEERADNNAAFPSPSSSSPSSSSASPSALLLSFTTQQQRESGLWEDSRNRGGILVTRNKTPLFLKQRKARALAREERVAVIIQRLAELSLQHLKETLKKEEKRTFLSFFKRSNNTKSAEQRQQHRNNVPPSSPISSKRCALCNASFGLFELRRVECEFCKRHFCQNCATPSVSLHILSPLPVSSSSLSESSNVNSNSVAVTSSSSISKSALDDKSNNNVDESDVKREKEKEEKELNLNVTPLEEDQIYALLSANYLNSAEAPGTSPTPGQTSLSSTQNKQLKHNSNNNGRTTKTSKTPTKTKAHTNNPSPPPMLTACRECGVAVERWKRATEYKHVLYSCQEQQARSSSSSSSIFFLNPTEAPPTTQKKENFNSFSPTEQLTRCYQLILQKESYLSQLLLKYEENVLAVDTAFSLQEENSWVLPSLDPSRPRSSSLVRSSSGSSSLASSSASASLRHPSLEKRASPPPSIIASTSFCFFKEPGGQTMPTNYELQNTFSTLPEQQSSSITPEAKSPSLNLSPLPSFSTTSFLTSKSNVSTLTTDFAEAVKIEQALQQQFEAQQSRLREMTASFINTSSNFPTQRKDSLVLRNVESALRQRLEAQLHHFEFMRKRLLRVELEILTDIYEAITRLNAEFDAFFPHLESSSSVASSSSPHTLRRRRPRSLTLSSAAPCVSPSPCRASISVSSFPSSSSDSSSPALIRNMLEEAQTKMKMDLCMVYEYSDAKEDDEERLRIHFAQCRKLVTERTEKRGEEEEGKEVELRQTHNDSMVIKEAIEPNEELEKEHTEEQQDEKLQEKEEEEDKEDWEFMLMLPYDKRIEYLVSKKLQNIKKTATDIKKLRLQRQRQQDKRKEEKRKREEHRIVMEEEQRMKDSPKKGGLQLWNTIGAKVRRGKGDDKVQPQPSLPLTDSSDSVQTRMSRKMKEEDEHKAEDEEMEEEQANEEDYLQNELMIYLPPALMTSKNVPLLSLLMPKVLGVVQYQQQKLVANTAADRLQHSKKAMKDLVESLTDIYQLAFETSDLPPPSASASVSTISTREEDKASSSSVIPHYLPPPTTPHLLPSLPKEPHNAEQCSSVPLPTSTANGSTASTTPLSEPSVPSSPITITTPAPPSPTKTLPTPASPSNPTTKTKTMSSSPTKRLSVLFSRTLFSNTSPQQPTPKQK
ncbi:hypothetical protein QOT17_013553 [Balamuthia mandrillaris]